MKNLHLHGIYLAAIGFVVMVALVGAHEWASHREQLAELRGSLKAKEQEAQQLQQQVQDEKARRVEIAANFQSQLDDLKKRPQTAPQVIDRYIPFTQPPPQAILPDAPSTSRVANPGDVILTPPQQQEIASFAIKCKQCEAERQSLQTELDQQTKISELRTQERDQALKAAKGGTLKKTLGFMVDLSCAGAGAYLGEKGGSAKGATIGAVAGALACHLTHR